MKIGPMLADSILARLVAAIGIDPRVLDAARLRWIVASRCKALGLPDGAGYATYLETTQAELDVLIDEVVVQETRFFRDPAVFEYVRRAIAELAASVAGPLRVLSAPCGTGQEAYSLAAMMRLAGVPAARFEVDAFDISGAALEAARRGLYPARALSQVSEELRKACGTVGATNVTVHDELRERVHFERRNLAAAGALGETRYHVILCRNLFIYLGANAREELARSLAGALLPGGRLFLGTADRVEELNGLFAPLRPAASFAFQHRSGEVAVKVMRRAAHPVQLAEVAVGRRGRRAVQAAPEAPVTAEELYQRALEHRRRGEVAKAERRCRQSLYLAPDYLPALELLQALWDRNPNMRLRRALRDRIMRSREATA